MTGTYRRNPNGISFFSKGQEQKQYEYFKSCFLLILKYLPKFNCSQEIESKVYARNIEYVLKPAIQFGDKGIFLCELNDIIFEKEKQIKKTLSYRIGNFLLWPLKKIKGLNIE